MTDSTADQLPDEPTGATIDGTPWEESRPPHLPDTVTGLPIPTILFTLGAIGIGILTIRDRLPDAGAGPGGPVVWFLSLSIPVVSFLIPAVFFLRHRDAWSAHRAMALGTTLFAVSRAVGLLNSYLGDWFISILPNGDLGISPLSIVMQVVVSAIAVLAVVYLARGLIEARLYADRPGTRRWWVLIGLVAAASAAMALLLFGTISPDLEDAAFVNSYWLVMLSVVINIVTMAAWAYLTGTAVAGRRAGEDPNFGWFLAAFAGFCILATFVVSGLATAMNIAAETNTSTNVLALLTALPAIAYLALLAAFATRLPTTHAPVDEAEDEEDGLVGSDDPTEATATPDDLAGSTA
jgi:MFS family permease